MPPRSEQPADGRPALTPDGIVAAATELIERDGLDTFTMRALGRELGVSAMAVYGYFSSREALLAEVLSRFMATMDTAPIPGERWDDTLRRTMHSIMAEELAHPEIASISVSPEVGGGGLESHTENIVNLHLSQGMSPEILAKAWAMVDAYLTGFADNVIALRAAGLDESAEEDGAAAEVPLWKRIVASAYSDEAFSEGVEIIISGIRALAAPDPCDWRTPEEG